MMRAELILIWCGTLEACFNLVRIFAGGETRAVRNTENMCIDGDRGLPKRFVQNDVRGLASNAGQADQLIPRLRNLAAKFVDDHLAQRDDVFSLIAPQADGFDMTFNACETERQHLLWRIRDLEQRFRGFVDANICGLRRQGYRHDQSVRIDEVEFRLRVRAIFCELSEKLCGFFLAEGAGRAFAFRLLGAHDSSLRCDDVL